MKWLLLTLSLTAIAVAFISLLLGHPTDLSQFIILLTLFGMFWGLPLLIVIGLFVGLFAWVVRISEKSRRGKSG
jgi:H+/Cl- antiporter ClcA